MRSLYAVLDPVLRHLSNAQTLLSVLQALEYGLELAKVLLDPVHLGCASAVVGLVVGVLITRRRSRGSVSPPTLVTPPDSEPMAQRVREYVDWLAMEELKRRTRGD